MSGLPQTGIQEQSRICFFLQPKSSVMTWYMLRFGLVMERRHWELAGRKECKSMAAVCVCVFFFI